MTDGLEQPAGKGQSTSEEVETEPTDLRASLIEMAVVEHKESAEQFRQTSEQRQEHLHKLGIGTAGRSGAALRRALDGVEAPFAAKIHPQQPRPSGESTGQKLNEGFQPVQDDAQLQRGALRVRPPKVGEFVQSCKGQCCSLQLAVFGVVAPLSHPPGGTRPALPFTKKRSPTVQQANCVSDGCMLQKCVECGSMDTPMWRTHPVHGKDLADGWQHFTVLPHIL